MDVHAYYRTKKDPPVFKNKKDAIEAFKTLLREKVQAAIS